MKIFLTLVLLMLASGVQARSIVFIGDSLTEGYGLEPEEAYPMQLEKLLHAQGKTDIKIINGGVSGSTTASAGQRVKWYLKAKPSLIVLALGANDGLRGISPAESRKNLAQAIRLATEAGVKVLLAEMKLPKNYGEAYREDFEKTYVELAKQTKVPVLAFMLEGVGGIPKMNQADGIHPTAEGQKKVADNMLKALGPHL
jgi:acyl-CoA thioesterase-1